MAINSSVLLGALTKYVDQLSTDIVHEIVLQGRTQNFISVQTGIKYADALNIMTSNLVLQPAGCNLVNATGSVTLTQNNLQVCPLMVEESICMQGNNSLEQYWTGMSMKKGSYYDELGPEVFAKAYTADKMDKIQGVIDDLIWVGSTTGGYSTDPNMTQCDGFLKIIDTSYKLSVIPVGATNATYPTPNGYTFSGPLTIGGAADAITVIDAMASALPQDLWDQEDLTVFLSYANFRTYIRDLRGSQPIAYNFPALESDGSLAYSIYHPGTNIRLVATRGLKGSNRMILTPGHNLYFGTDLEHDHEMFRIWKSEDFNTVFFRAMWKQGVQVAYPQYIVSYNG